MAYQALMFCADPRTTRVLTGVLNDLAFNAEACGEPFEAVKKLTERHFDAVIVDCDDQQNAALLFKSARNSQLNSASLAVGIVAGQAAITKAFQIGANLVLTKPINIEQAKGTLRVARGLLKKSEQAKTPSREPEPMEPPVAGAPPLAVNSVAAAVPMLQLEAEEEPTPPLGPAEAALLESMPETLPTPATGLAQSKTDGWRPVSRAAAEPLISTLESAGPFTLDSSKPNDASTLAGGFSLGPGRLADLAAGKGLVTPVAEPITTEAATNAPTGEQSGMDALEPKQSSSKASSGASVEPPSFSWHEAAREHDESEDKDSRKNLLIAAVLVLALAGAAYYAWPRLQPSIMSLPFVQKYIAPYVGRLVSQAAPGAPAKAAGAMAQSTAAISQPVAADSSQEPTQEEGSAVTPASANAGASATPHESIVVKGEPSQASSNPNAAQMKAPSAASSAPSGSSGSSRTLQISESAMEGLLLRKVQPIYPAQAAQMRVEGLVLLQATIDKDGSIVSLKPLRGAPSLTGAAMDAVRQWKYKPYLLNGQPTEVQTEITVKFKLP